VSLSHETSFLGRRSLDKTAPMDIFYPALPFFPRLPCVLYQLALFCRFPSSLDSFSFFLLVLSSRPPTILLTSQSLDEEIRAHLFFPTDAQNRRLCSFCTMFFCHSSDRSATYPSLPFFSCKLLWLEIGPHFSFLRLCKISRPPPNFFFRIIIYSPQLIRVFFLQLSFLFGRMCSLSLSFFGSLFALSA